MIMLPFSSTVSSVLQFRTTEYLRQADAKEASTGIQDAPVFTYAKALTFVLTEVLCNVLYALRASQGGTVEDLRKLTEAALEKAIELDRRDQAAMDRIKPKGPVS